MSELNFEGDLQYLSEGQLNFIKSVLVDRGYTDNKVILAPVGAAGDNYMANVLRLTVEERDGGTFKMVAKIAPQIEKARENMNTHVAFNNEHVMYREVFPKFDELQNNAQVPEENRFKHPKCYGSSIEAPNEVILLEDLKLANYEMFDRFQSLSDESIRLILKQLAVLHSLSYALKKEDKETYNELENKLYNIWAIIGDMEEVKKYVGMIEEQLGKSMVGMKNEKYIKDSVSQIPVMGKELIQSEKESKHTIIQHGDTWTNNIMFKVQEGRPIEALPIDYQMSKMTSPVADILYLIFNCTSYEKRSKCFHDWIDFYYSELDKSLNFYGLKANNTYPREILDAELLQYGKCMYCVSVLLVSVLIRESSEVIDMKTEKDIDMDEMLEKQRTMMTGDFMVRFRDRIDELIETCKELGYF